MKHSELVRLIASISDPFRSAKETHTDSFTWPPALTKHRFFRLSVLSVINYLIAGCICMHNSPCFNTVCAMLGRALQILRP